MRPLTLACGLQVRPYRPDDAGAIHRAVESTRERLARWMPWVPYSTTVASYEAFIRQATRQEDEGTAIHRGLFTSDAVAGGLGAILDPVNREAEVGYWIVPAWEGRGAITEATTALLDHLFDDEGTHRVTIRAAVENTRSRAVARRLGFTEEGILREALVLGGVSVDAAISSILEPEWRERRD